MKNKEKITEQMPARLLFRSEDGNDSCYINVRSYFDLSGTLDIF